jgi:hypothetical protein
MKTKLRFSIIVFISFLIVITISCKKLGLCNDEELNLVRKDLNDNTIKTNGFYYRHADTDYRGVKLFETFILYKNGILMLPGTAEYGELNDYITMISKSNVLDTKFVWGLFEIKNNTIRVNHWVAAQCGYPALLRTGVIINDTTFVLKKMTRIDSQGTKESDIDEEFHFRQINTKPDSTNNYIK